MRHGVFGEVACDLGLMHPIERGVSLPLHLVVIDVQLLRLEGDP